MTNEPESLSEFEIIARFFTEDTGNADGVDLGVGDDCALLSIPPGQRLALSIDTAVAGRHFPHDAAAADIAYRTVAAATSDLAAMGATPVAATLALTLSQVDQPWLEQFSRGLQQAMQDFGMALVGGDTTRGPLTITVQVHGFVPDRQAMLRSGARVGDRIFVSGCLGDAAAALQLFAGELTLDQAQADYLYRRFYRPQPRLALGRALLPLASSAIDISDGLLADLGHVAAASGVAAQIVLDRIPLSDVLNAHKHSEAIMRGVLSGGDDYELCFTVPEISVDKLEDVARQCQLRLTEIGRMVEGSGVLCLDNDNKPVPVEVAGYQHF